MSMIFRCTLFLLLLVPAVLKVGAEEPLRPDVTWPLDNPAAGQWSEKGGAASSGAGVSKNSVVLKGRSLLELKNSAATASGGKPFTFVIWLNPYNVNRGQQMIAAKNRYSLGEREWSLMVDKDKKLRLYVHQAGWKTAETGTALQPGHWYQAAVVVRQSKAELWVNGQLADNVPLTRPIAQTKALLTLGGVNDNGRIWQTFQGALDNAMLFNRGLQADEIAKLYTPVAATHQLPDYARPAPLWDQQQPLPAATAIANLPEVKFSVIKKWDRNNDGYTFLHGVGLGWHKEKLYASFGHNKGAENTVTEEAQYRVSDDQGRTWSATQVLDAGAEKDLAVSHGVFHSHGGTLWAFHGAYNNRMQNIHTRAYTLDETTGKWIKHGVVVGDGFWPMNQPVKMADGNWIMAGFSAGRYAASQVFPAAVAISHGDDFTKWDCVKIPASSSIARMWGESAIFVDGKRVYNIARYGGEAAALLAISEDGGRSWSPSKISNLPMATSKPAAGTLSTGQRYLICTTASNNGGKRSPLTIAVSRPGENTFSRVFVIRRSLHKSGESAKSLSLSYPCAIERNGYLYVGYSNNGGRRGNLNSAELAVIPVALLKVSP